MTERSNPNYVQLMKTIVEYSQSPIFEIANTEWCIISHYEERPGVTCLCGKEECVYVYVIKNFYNNNTLAPIGSSCMKYFEFNEQEKTILEIYEKWHFKLYRDPGGVYDQMEFHEVIKDFEYIRSLDTYGITKEDSRLVAYAKAVWIHNPPPPPKPIVAYKLPPSAPPKQECQKCVEQRRKGYKKCYDCFAEKKPKPVCEKCVEQKKKGYNSCYACYKQSL